MARVCLTSKTFYTPIRGDIVHMVDEHGIHSDLRVWGGTPNRIELCTEAEYQQRMGTAMPADADVPGVDIRTIGRTTAPGTDAAVS